MGNNLGTQSPDKLWMLSKEDAKHLEPGSPDHAKSLKHQIGIIQFAIENGLPRLVKCRNLEEAKELLSTTYSNLYKVRWPQSKEDVAQLKSIIDNAEARGMHPPDSDGRKYLNTLQEQIEILDYCIETGHLEIIECKNEKESKDLVANTRWEQKVYYDHFCSYD